MDRLDWYLLTNKPLDSEPFIKLKNFLYKANETARKKLGADNPQYLEARKKAFDLLRTLEPLINSISPAGPNGIKKPVVVPPRRGNLRVASIRL